MARRTALLMSLGLAIISVALAGVAAVCQAAHRPTTAMFTSETQEVHQSELLIVASWWLLAVGISAALVLLFGVYLRFRHAVRSNLARAFATVATAAAFFGSA